MWSILWEFSGPQLVQPYSAMLQGSLQKHCPLDLQWHLQFSSSYLQCDKDEVGKMEPQGVDVPRDKMWQFYYKKICVEFQSMEWSEREKDFFPGGVKKVKPEKGGPNMFFLTPCPFSIGQKSHSYWKRPIQWMNANFQCYPTTLPKCSQHRLGRPCNGVLLTFGSMLCTER